MFGKSRGWICFALTALAVSASAFVPDFKRLEEKFPNIGSGNTTVISNPASRIVYSYDPMNRLTNSSISVNSRSFAVTNAYDLNGNRTNIVYPGGLSVGYTYDAENRLESVTANYTNDTRMFSFGYDGASRMMNIAYPNGVGGEFEYDAESRITGYSYSGSSNFISHAIVRDPRGFKMNEDIIAGLEPMFPEGEQRMEHNDADQLTKITQRDTWLGGELNQWYKREYGYDNNGCLIQEYVSRELWNTNSAIDEYRAEYTWDYDNRLTGAGKTVLVPHDTIDGMTGAVMDRTYTDGPSVSTEYIYDASGVRIGRVYNSVTNYFVIDYKAPLKMPLAETEAEGNITRYYIWSSHGLLAHLDVNPSTGAITATRYYHSDEQGSTLALTDESGNVTDEFAYTPYGGVNHTGTTDTPYQWLGGLAVRNEGNGLYYMLNRYYSADMRRFISTDPSGIDGGVNLYSYAGLNPTAYSDPFGLEKTSSGSRFTAGSYNNIVSSVTGVNPSYKPPNTSATYLSAAPAGSYSKSEPTFQSYQNSPQYLAHDALLIGSSARNPVLAQANAAPFAVIGAGALSAVAIPAAGSAYGAASGFALDTSIKAYAAGSAAAGAVYQTGANLYSQASSAYLQNAPQINQATMDFIFGAYDKGSPFPPTLPGVAGAIWSEYGQ